MCTLVNDLDHSAASGGGGGGGGGGQGASPPPVAAFKFNFIIIFLTNSVDLM